MNGAGGGMHLRRAEMVDEMVPFEEDDMMWEDAAVPEMAMDRLEEFDEMPMAPPMPDMGGIMYKGAEEKSDTEEPSN